MSVRIVGYLREGLAAGVTRSPGSPGLRTVINARAEIEGLSTPIAAPPLALAGPADVASIDPTQIFRQVPAPDSQNAEVGGFAFVEFARADLPWIFSPFGPTRDKLAPWLVLVVVEKGAAVTLSEGTPISRLTVPLDQLPDLRESAAWAHAQVQASAGSAIDSYRAVPSAALSRLVCPRRLEPGRDYAACLVPAHRAGVLAGLGEAVGNNADMLELAWNSTTRSPLTLPVYHSWSFRTGLAGDFTSLVRKLSPLSDIGTIGTAAMTVAMPNSRSLLISQDGVLVPAGRKPAAANRRFSARIKQVLDLPGKVGPPSYGRWHAAARPTDSSGVPAWLKSLNLDVRRRVAAALGTAVVQRYQDEFMTAIWQQAGEIARANVERRLGGLSLATAKSLYVRRLSRRINAGDLGLLSFAAPALPLLSYSETVTFRGQLERTCLSPSQVGGALQKMLRGNGPLQRRLSRGMDGRRVELGAVLAQVIDGALRDAPPAPQGARLVNIAAFRRRVEIGRLPTVPIIIEPSAAAAQVGAIVAELRTLVARTSRAPCTPLPGDFLPRLAAVLDPETTIPKRVTRRATIPVTLRTHEQGLDEILVAPRLPAATSRYLLEENPDWLLPGLGQIAPDTITGFVPNGPFIEAFFTGLNHEIAREMIWRGFPTDQRGTVFDSFWVSDDRAIPPLHGWRSALGRHVEQTSGAGTVILVRGELIRHFPDVMVFLQPATGSPGAWRPDPAVGSAITVLPSFSQTITPDKRLIGFPVSARSLRGDDPARPGGYFLAFQEAPQALRFGPPVGSAFAANGYLPSSGDDAVEFATRLRRPASRSYFHASRFFAT